MNHDFSAEGYKEMSSTVSWPTNTGSVLVFEPKCGGRGEVAGSQPISTAAAVHRSPNKLWRSNSIFHLCFSGLSKVKIVFWFNTILLWYGSRNLTMPDVPSKMKNLQNGQLSHFFLNVATDTSIQISSSLLMS
jgi:hypothetical protein